MKISFVFSISWEESNLNNYFYSEPSFQFFFFSFFALKKIQGPENFYTYKKNNNSTVIFSMITENKRK